MRKGLVAWILLIIAAIVLYIFDNETVTLALLFALLAALPVSLLVLKRTTKNVEVTLGDPIHEGGKNIFPLSIRNKGILPIALIEADLNCVNLRTGESDIYSISRSLGPKKHAVIDVEVAPTHAGKYELSASNCKISDPLGIKTNDIKCEGSGSLTTLPDIYTMHIRPVSTAAMPESDLFSVRRKGSVTGDTVGIREYIAGDPVRNIHWKLSEKTDKLLVRELGEPQTDNYLILLGNETGIAQDPGALDATASVYASLIHSLLLNEITFNAGWEDPQTGEAVIRQITSEDDFNNAALSFLAVPASIPVEYSRLDEKMNASRYARVIVVGSDIPSKLDYLTNGCEVTVLMYGNDVSAGSPNMSVVGFDMWTYKTSLSMIEL